MPEITYLCATVVDNPADGTTAIFALNRNTTESLTLEATLKGCGTDRVLVEAAELHHGNLKAVNTKEAPNTVSPRPLSDVTVDGETLRAVLKPASWNVIVTRARAGT